LASFDYQRVSNVADRYAYLAMIAVALAIAGGLSQLPAGVARQIAYCATITTLIAWAALTSFQLRTWRNGVCLFTHAVDVNPHSYYCFQCLAQADLAADDPTGAVQASTRSIELNPATEQFHASIAARGSTSMPPPSYAPAWAEAAQAHVARGDAFDRLNRFNEAIDEFSIAVQMNPRNAIAVTNMAFVLGRTGRIAEAQAWLHRALEIDPSFAPARAALQRINSNTNH
jgi:tetratricopeptide (TPR) repeat protein